MSLRWVCLALSAAFLAFAPAARAEEQAKPASGYAYYEIGDLKARTPGKVQSGMMLMGGGDWSVDAFRWFVARAGGGHIVVLRASGEADLQEELYRDIGGMKSVQTLVFSDRKAASDPRVLELVRKADGVFLGGGDQANYVRFWKGTPLNAALDAHVRAGRPIGGTSAGLAILGAYSYGALDGGSVVSPDALKDPLGSEVTLVRDFLHLPHLARVVTDSHFAQRDRLGRLIVFVARLSHEEKRDDLVGVGVDESTALCIDGAGKGRVFTGKNGFAWLVQPARQPDRIEAGAPLDFRGISVTGLGPSSVIDMKTLNVQAPAFHFTADVAGGVLTRRLR